MTEKHEIKLGFQSNLVSRHTKPCDNKKTVYMPGIKIDFEV